MEFEITEFEIAKVYCIGIGIGIGIYIYCIGIGIYIYIYIYIYGISGEINNNKCIIGCENM